MMIHLPNGYNGRLVNYQSVPPGDYADDDPRLFGIADYLVENRFATRLDAPVVETEPVAAPPEDVAVASVTTAVANKELVDAIADGIRQATLGTSGKPKPKRR